MSSVIFYRFRSQKDPSRILFDGTGLTVFDLKREIIFENKLGDGLDFQLKLFTPDTEEEYEDDAQVIPRSSSVIVRRSPAIKATNLNSRPKLGALAAVGNATRYVTGKPRVLQKKSTVLGGNPASPSRPVTGVTEEERIANMFANQENQWEQTQQEMSSATPVFFKSASGAANNSDADGPPPPGYMCYRCGGRDHWIKNCPTNTDPNFEGKRIKRTTGIPKKFLKSVEIDPDSMTAEEMAQKKIMITDEGKFVVQVADQTSWEDYQRKQQNRLLNGNNVYRKGYYKDLPESLKCPITGGLLKDPIKTKCCNKYFSKTALEDSLVESDFVCPGCDTPDILLDSLVEDKERKQEVDKYIEEHKSNQESLNVTDNIIPDITAGVTRHDVNQINNVNNQLSNAEPDAKKRKLNEQQAGTPNAMPAVPMPMPPFGMAPFPMAPFPMAPFPMPFPMQSAPQQQLNQTNSTNSNTDDKVNTSTSKEQTNN
ncbi:hypothetical protein TPHA_0C02700 [Tetrapisispora phaffii CBS 4417]|uniref:DWNN domain-containing protein n=1 Tax=Tetrapisispora phaffii (strain ATCC 24235 / CBS 4417 / NBRC 1672 / NRRL Y-8282 / UCD 70-5) TaxID=1071381 RepID=G8BRP7_TETPH|nr:hypothetical protein TPHA_0C02700 [Tetrapisispora phaffii CBS 4417]CCE62423.1 hypothetical protein TPHA_0C02700 [Tetrapisispora phaffii CBS 4417]